MGESATEKIKEVAVTAPRCPVCKTGLSRQGLVLCRRCDTPHHRRCWSYNKGCGVFGCSSRVMVAPPQARADGDADPKLVFRRQLVYPDDRFGAMLALVVLVTFFYQVHLVLPALLVFLLPVLVSFEHRVLDDAVSIERRVLLGPLTLWRQGRWLGYGEVESLEVRPRGGDRSRGPWEIWARDLRGREFLLEVTGRGSEDQVLARLALPAERIDTVVTTPRDGAAALSAGLQETLDALPEEPDLGDGPL